MVIRGVKRMSGDGEATEKKNMKGMVGDTTGINVSKEMTGGRELIEGGKRQRWNSGMPRRGGSSRWVEGR